MEPVPRSLLWATDLDVLPADRVVERVDDHLVVRSPSNPRHWWGNFLLFDGPPRVGDGSRWEAALDRAFADLPEIRHRTFGWEGTDGDAGAAEAELVARGYALERTVGLVAGPGELVRHPRASGSVEIRALDPAPGADEALWAGALDVQLRGNAEDPEPIADFAPYARAQQADRRALCAAGRGAWYAAIAPDGEVIGGCGVVATGSRGRFQAVDVVGPARGRGVATRLVHEAAADAAARFGLTTLVIGADPDHHAIGIYESVGFRRREVVCGAARRVGD